jgi:proteic killer suppression protein
LKNESLINTLAHIIHGWNRQVLSYRLQSADENSRLRTQGLKRLYEDNSAKGVPPETAEKLRKMLAFLDAMQEADELRALTVWKAHTLLGDRGGTWSLSVTRNRRLTFWIDDEPQICDVNLEDYH